MVKRKLKRKLGRKYDGRPLKADVGDTVVDATRRSDAKEDAWKLE